MAGIDLNRGVTIRGNVAGVRVYMYKDSPGEFHDVLGDPVTQDVARAAGFDVDRLLRERQKQERILAMRAQIEWEYEGVSKTVEQEMLRESSPEAANGQLVTETDSFTLQDRGQGWYDVRDKDGSPVNPKAMREGEANAFLEELRSGTSIPQTAEAANEPEA